MSGQKELFFKIAEEEPHICWTCDKAINELMYGNFAHILGKGAYPKFKLYQPNIKIMCFNLNGTGCHNKYDTKAESDLLKESDKWIKVFELKQELKQLYYEQNKQPTFPV